jgi:hypothetical protein
VGHAANVEGGVAPQGLSEFPYSDVVPNDVVPNGRRHLTFVYFSGER